jgi:hypothetical protein
MIHRTTNRAPRCARAVNYGVTTFDKFGWATIIILQSLTFDGWTEAMYDVIRATSEPLIIGFSLSIVVAGGFFIVNLFLGVTRWNQLNYRRCACAAR